VAMGERLGEREVDVGVVEGVGEDAVVAVEDGEEEGERDRKVEEDTGDGDGRRAGWRCRRLPSVIIHKNAVHRRTIPFAG